MPILARHAVSLCLAFAVGLVLSYFAGQYIYQEIQLNKLHNSDPATFNEGLAYVVKHAGGKPSITDDAMNAVSGFTDAPRAADLLLAVAQSHANREEPADPIIPASVTDAISPLMQRLDAMQAIGLYDALVQIEGIAPLDAASSLLNSLDPQDDGELLQVVDLLDTRLLWSRQFAPMDLWVRWLGVLSESKDELTQFNTTKRLGDLPDAVDNPFVAQALATLANSEHDTVRAAVLNAAAGYASQAKNPTEYEQIIFTLGEDQNKIIARRAWMVVGHLNPLSGFAMDWQAADPFVGEAILWAAAKTNPENPKPAWAAFDAAETRPISLLALSQLRDDESVKRLDQAKPPVALEQINIDPDRLIQYLSTADADLTVLEMACVSLRINQQDTPELIERLVRMRQPKPRLLGAFLAAMRDMKPQLIEGDFVNVLKQSPETTADDLHAMPDEQLAALGLRRVDALAALFAAAESSPLSANRSVEAKLLKLALWMRGELGDDFTASTEAMLFDKELPNSTVLMCLLQMQRPIALDYLFGDVVTPRPDLHKLFVQQRFGHVFSHFVATDDLSLWLNSPPKTQAFQLEAMQQWYAVNRWKIEGGWWPEPK